jgi:hypothetical protein
MGCIAIVCVLLFWFGYFGILAKWVVPLFSWFLGFGAAGSGFSPPPFRPAILSPSQTLSDARRETLAVFPPAASRPQKALRVVRFVL